MQLISHTLKKQKPLIFLNFKTTQTTISTGNNKKYGLWC